MTEKVKKTKVQMLIPVEHMERYKRITGEKDKSRAVMAVLNMAVEDHPEMELEPMRLKPFRSHQIISEAERREIIRRYDEMTDKNEKYVVPKLVEWLKAEKKKEVREATIYAILYRFGWVYRSEDLIKDVDSQMKARALPAATCDRLKLYVSELNSRIKNDAENGQIEVAYDELKQSALNAGLLGG